MIAPMFWNLCKSSWRRGFLLILLLYTHLLTQYGESSSVLNIGCGVLYEGHSLKDGAEAGLFNKLGRTEDVTKCVKYCCDASDCKTALFVGKLKSCYSVDCKSSDACNPALKTSQKYGMSIFRKNIKGQASKSETKSIGTKMNDDPNRPLVREKRHESCHHYHGSQCTKFLNKKLLYFNEYPPYVEKSLLKPLYLLKQIGSPNCKKYGIAGICHYAFPYCSDRSKPSPTRLCQEDCKQLYSGVCKQEFGEILAQKNLIEYKKILPDCEQLPSVAAGPPGSSDCTPLNIPDSLKAFPKKPTISQSTAALLNTKAQDKQEEIESHKDEENINLLKQTVNISSNNVKQNPINGDAYVLQQNNDGTDIDVKQRIDNIPTQTSTSSNPTKTAEDKDKHSDNKEINTQISSSDSGASGNVKSTGLSLTNNTGDNHLSVSDDGVNGKSGLGSPKTGNISETQGGNKDASTRDNDSKEAKNARISHFSITSSPINTSISESYNKGDKKGESRKEDDEELPTSSSIKRPGLGLQESLSMLEPTESSMNTRMKNHSSLPSPTINQQPTFLNSTSNDAYETNLAVTSASKKGHDSALTNTTESLLNTMASSNRQKSCGSTRRSRDGDNCGQSGLNASVSHPPSTKPATVPALTTFSPTEAPTLQVSAGENKILTLPANSIELYASAFPRETSANPYAYHWQQISAPQDSHGYMEGKDTRRVILSKLSHVGVYQFKVTVKGTKNGAFGFAFVNVTVRPVPRVNKPPRADISPKEQVITLPTNMVVLDGSKSSDDDKITQYKWEEVKGPLNDKNKMISSGADSPVLQLKSLVPGIYTFKLTVVDSDGEKDSTTATVTVNNEKDYPPVARAGNDVVLTLPINHLTLNGNGSTDDKGIVSYEWSKAPSSPAVGDMQGTNSPILKVSNMVVGDYTFILKVTDTGGQSASSKVTVVVQPEKNTPPVAMAGSDKDLVYPDDSTTLDAKGSHDDQKIVKYHWDQESGPSSAEISGADEKIATVKKLQEGDYVFKLTVTDDKGLSGTDTVAVNVKKDINQSPVARAGPDVVVRLPNRAAELDGSKSSDDHGIADYVWYRDPKSPAAGDVINNSNHQAVLRLSNLVEGIYKFKLTVVDGKGLKSSDEALLTVKEDENSAHLVELYLDVDITKFTEENKGQLIRKLAVILDVQDDDIVVEHLKETGTGHSMMVMFYVKTPRDAKDGQIVAELLKAKIENEEGFFEFRMLRVEPYICRNNCSFHGYCDRRTKLCVCESFWMQNIFKSSFGVRESNCDWSILYVTVIIFGIIMGIGGIIWAICFCMGRASRLRRLRDDKVVSVEPPLLTDTTAAESSGRRGRSRRRHRYAVLDEDDDDDKAERMEMLPKGKYSHMMLSDSDEDSDETTLFEVKKRIPNGTLNGSIGRKAM